MKILVILPRFPYPLEKGDKLRAYYQIKHLSKNNDIVLCAVSSRKVKPEEKEKLDKLCSEVHVFEMGKATIAYNVLKAFFSGKPLQAGYFYSGKIKNEIMDIIRKSKPDHIYCQLVRTAEYAREIDGIPKTIDYQDAFSKGVERRFKTDPVYYLPLLKLEYSRLLRYERDVFELFENKTIISEQDRDLIDHPEKNKIQIVRNGVDLDFYKPIAAEKKYELLFIGNMNYQPNVSAVNYIASEIMPLLENEFPNIKFMIAGANPAKSVLKLQSENIEVTGWVDDIRKCYAESGIFLAPMQIGIGLQNKLLQAMAMEIPCISSALANNALGAVDGKEILIGKTPADYAKLINYLLCNKDFAAEIARKGREFVENNYNWDALTESLDNMFRDSRV